MTADEIAEAARALVARTTRAQGLPERIEDPLTLRRVASIVRAAPNVQRSHASAA